NDTDPDGDVLSLASVSAVSAQGGSVVQRGSIISYTPPSGFNGADTFTYTVKDSHGESATGTVRVTVTVPTTPVLAIVDLGNNDFRISFNGTPGLVYAIEFTESLSPPAWQRLGLAAENPPGFF